MRNIQIVFVNDNPFSLGFGGKEVQLLSYERYLNNQKNFSVKRLDFWSKNDLENCSILHIFGSTKGLHTLVRAAKLNFPHIKIVLSPNFYSAHPFIESILVKLTSHIPIPNIFSYRKELFTLSDLLIVNSLSEKNQIEKIYLPLKKEKSRISVILNGIEDNFHNLEDKSIFCKKFNLNPGYLLSVAFLGERKNSINLIKSFLSTIKMHNRKLVLIGDYRFSDSQKSNECRELIQNYPDRILHIPYIDRGNSANLLKSAYANCHAHLLPSILETPGISTIEALAYGCPILVGDCKPVRDYFIDVPIYCKPTSLDDISRKILFIATNDFGKAFNALSGKFTWSNILRDLPHVYNSLV